MLGEPDTAALYNESCAKRLCPAHSQQMVSERENLSPYTMEEIREGIRRSEADIAAGRVVSNDRVFAELEIMLSLPWLRYSGAEPQSGNFR